MTITLEHTTLGVQVRFWESRNGRSMHCEQRVWMESRKQRGHQS